MRNYPANLLAALTRDGVDLDETENAALDGAPGQTISMRCALAQARGAVWAHVACALLSVLVQWRHCSKQLAGVPMRWWNYGLALFWLLGVPAALIFTAVHFVWLLTAAVALLAADHAARPMPRLPKAASR